MKVVVRTESRETSTDYDYQQGLLDRFGAHLVPVLGLSTSAKHGLRILIAQDDRGWGLRFVPISLFEIVDAHIPSDWKITAIQVLNQEEFFLGIYGLEDYDLLDSVMDQEDESCIARFQSLVQGVEFDEVS